MNATLWIIVAASALQAAPPHAENQVLTELHEQGTSLGGAEPVRLTAPVMADGLDAAAQQAVLKQVAGTAYPLDRLLRNSPVAPHLLQQREIDGPQGRGRVIDVYFVLYGQLETLDDPDVIERAMNTEEDEDVAQQGGTLTAEQLAARKIPWDAARKDYENYASGTISLWKRVEVSSVVHSQTSRSAESLIAATILDRRFDQDAEIANRWWPLKLNDNGSLQRGAQQTYSGMGMYLKFTRLHQPAGALFCEGHGALAEPQGWFDGANQLGSKLPAIVQSRVRALRREVALASKR